MLTRQDDTLDNYYQQVQNIILNRQDWISGLLPASTAINVHGNYTDAWVRDNVYSILAAWGLGLAYRKRAGRQDRRYVLEQSVVKLMRGLLTSMMRQANKVEKFKQTQAPLDALHAKYNTQTGAVVVGDSDWGHLQLDATSLYLLMLAQMTASGLHIIFSIDEVNFVQNLVHYISRAYRTPDYGIWERGNKLNHGIAELNASSLGMAKAALEAMAGCNLFGKEGGQTSVIHVISDDIARTRIALESLLPRESISKEADSAVLSITGFPAFAIDNVQLREKTESLIVEKLQGRYGCKRFLLDGHQTLLEDPQRLHYEPHELKQFLNIECEWPLFFCYLLLNHLFAGNEDAARDYRGRLDDLLIEQNGQQLLPELYIVPATAIAAEKKHPHSQSRIANDNVPLVWAQSLFILSNLLQDNLITPDDIDPLGRYKSVNHRQAGCCLQIALLAEDDAVKWQLQEYGIQALTPTDIAPIQVRDAGELAAAYTQVGRNDRIGLSGRPLRQLRTLATSKLYLLAGEPLIFLPQFMNQKGFYIAMDNRMLIQRLRMELVYVSRHWDKPAPALMVINIKQNMLAGADKEILLHFIEQLKQGTLQDLTVTVGLLTDFVTSASREKINYLHDFKFQEMHREDTERPFADALPSSDQPPQTINSFILTSWEIGEDALLIQQLQSNANLYAQLEALSLLSQRHGLDYETCFTAAGQALQLRDLLEEVYARAGDLHIWQIVRRCAALLGKYDINLEQAATDILVRQHALTLGHAYSAKATLHRPADSTEILEIIRTFNSNDASQHIIIQELVIYLGLLIKMKPELFADMHTIRVGHIVQLLIARQKRRSGSSLDQAFNEILSLAPYQLSNLLQETLEDYSSSKMQLGEVETLHYDGSHRQLSSARFPVSMNPKHLSDAEDWYAWREQQGSVGRESDTFFSGVWSLLPHCHGLVIGEKINSNNRIDSEITLSQMTPGERTFKLHVNHLLNKIQAPVYRQLTVETLQTLALIVQHNPDLHVSDSLFTDILIGYAVKLSWLHLYPEHQEYYDNFVSLAWQAFYQLPPHAVANGILDALIYLLNNHQEL